MKEKDWIEIDVAVGCLEDALYELRAAYFNQIKRLEKRLEDLITADKNTLKSLKEVLKYDFGNRVAYEYLEKIVLDFEKDVE